jgi:AcrR family transcriptional regulator
MTSLRHTDPRESYLDAARACILDVGWRRTSITEVARRAGVSRMTIYRAWPDMGSLLGDLLTREWAHLLTPVGAPATSDAVAATVVTMVAALRRDPLFQRIVAVDADLLLPYLIERRGRLQDLVLGLLTDAIRAGQKAGTVRRGRPDVLARSVLLLSHGFALSAGTMTDDRVTAKALDRELALTITRSLAP